MLGQRKLQALANRPPEQSYCNCRRCGVNERINGDGRGCWATASSYEKLVRRK
jgi:hypothetical protein